MPTIKFRKHKAVNILNFTISFKIVSVQDSEYLQYYSYLQNTNSVALHLEFPSSESECEFPSNSDSQYNPIYVYIDIEMSLRRLETGCVRHVAVKGWYRTVRSLPTAEGRRGMTGGQWGASPMTNSACFQSPKSLRASRKQGDGRIAFPLIPPPSVIFQTVYAFPNDEGRVQSAGYFCLRLYGVFRDVRYSAF